ncbi:hypothetical protein WDU99_07720 [Microbacterium sp. Mu-80]|uniref:Restriction endonuclease n=1 Tax=Microbacterium bandirmense TaxID=3122050 RepID=A0ABU8LB29_9MICO
MRVADVEAGFRWCARGGRANVVPASGDVVVESIYRDFPPAVDENHIPHDWFTVAQERRAPLNLHAFTGLTPERVDDGTRSAAVDLLLHGDDIRLVVEVTSTATAIDEKTFDRSERLVERINAHYDGSSHWALHFGSGYAPPSNSRRATAFADSVVRDLRELDLSGGDLVELPTARWLRARKIPDGQALVEAVAWDSRVKPSEGTVVEGLDGFLRSPLILSKRDMVAESERIEADARHLYLYASPAGANAHVFPRNAWHLTESRVALPSGIDVLWIDTRGQFTYRYSAEDGISVHRN